MFIQIVEWVVKFVGLLGDASVLSSARNRKRIGKSIVKLHSLITEIVENATAIRSELVNIEKLSDKEESIYLYAPLVLLLGEQRQLLNSLKETLRSQRELLNIYGDNCTEEIQRIAGLKVSLIDVITMFSLYNTNNLWLNIDNPRKYYLPRSFNLEDFAEFKNEVERRKKLAESLGENLEKRNQQYNVEYDFQTLLHENEFHNKHNEVVFAIEVGNNPDKDKEVIKYLLAQIDEMKAVEKLSSAQAAISSIVKNNFTVEELF